MQFFSTISSNHTNFPKYTGPHVYCVTEAVQCSVTICLQRQT